MTKKNELHQIRKKEFRDSRIKQTLNLIHSKSFSSLMNNHKWFSIFELIEQNNSEFELKTLLSSRIKKVNQVIELEKSSILIDNSGDFIEFLELEQIIIYNSSELKAGLKKLNVEFTEVENLLEINGYLK